MRNLTDWFSLVVLFVLVGRLAAALLMGLGRWILKRIQTLKNKTICPGCNYGSKIVRNCAI